MEVRENYSLKKYNTFDIDVKCRYFVECDQEADLLEFVASYEWEPTEILILGGGSNFLFTEDFDGTVFYPSMKGIETIEEDATGVSVRVGAGVVWDDFVGWAVEHQYGGVENLSLIPGHVGASPVQNVGAYGMEAGDTILRVEAIDIEKACPVVIGAADCRFAYRDSIFKKEWKNKYIITRVVFRLSKQPQFRLNYGNVKNELEKLGGEITLAKIRQAIIQIRQDKLPDVKVIPNAGSFFKNPMVEKEVAEKLHEQYPEMPIYEVDEDRVKLAAGWMIEQCGWKGKMLGKAGVHSKQALVLVNGGGADGMDVTRLANEVKKSVFMKFGVWIEPEVYVI
ncbi:MAG: UDP-N-acetylmuramate dehydrogenase [Odoribacter sp.]